MSNIISTAEQALKDKARQERIVEGVTVTVSSGLILGLLYGIWHKIRGTK